MSEAVTGILLVELPGVGDMVSVPRRAIVAEDEGNAGEAVVGVAVIRIAVAGEDVGVSVSSVVTVGVIVRVTEAVAEPVGVGLAVVVGETVGVILVVEVGVMVGVSVFCCTAPIVQREDKMIRNAPVLYKKPGDL